MNYYEELGLPRSATTKEIREAYRNLVRVLHPDQFQDDPTRRLGELQMRRLNQIVETLTDPGRRRRYDLTLHASHGPRPIPPGERWAPVIVPPPAPPSSRFFGVLFSSGIWVFTGAIAIASIFWYFSAEGGSAQNQNVTSLLQRQMNDGSGKRATAVPERSSALERLERLRAEPQREAEAQLQARARIQKQEQQADWQAAAGIEQGRSSAAGRPSAGRMAAAKGGEGERVRTQESLPLSSATRTQKEANRLAPQVANRARVSGTGRGPAAGVIKGAALSPDSQVEVTESTSEPLLRGATLGAGVMNRAQEAVAAIGEEVRAPGSRGPFAAAPGATGSAAAVTNGSVAPLDAQDPAPAASAARNSIAGRWIYRRTNKNDNSKTLYPPEYIELNVVEESGLYRGQYRARYVVHDRPISPDVSFRFEGSMTGPKAKFPWVGTGASRGEVEIRMVNDHSIEVNWAATSLGRSLGLAAGTAVLLRRLD
jgi:curved DNA-binding protein CbpA